ncbi:photosystem II protein Y [Prochlorothrix hollandica]|nr:photosystem II protein Y [Prochlorothrix hollandica]
MDLRVLIVLLPLGVAAGWAVFNVFQGAKEQLDRMLNN